MRTIAPDRMPALPIPAIAHPMIKAIELGAAPQNARAHLEESDQRQKDILGWVECVNFSPQELEAVGCEHESASIPFNVVQAIELVGDLGNAVPMIVRSYEAVGCMSLEPRSWQYVDLPGI